MTDPRIRAILTAIDLLSEIDTDRSSVLDCRYFHDDGRPFSPAETALAAWILDRARSGDPDRFDAIARSAEHLRETQGKLGDLHRWTRLAAPYWEKHGEQVPLAELMDLMSDADRAEASAILGRLRAGET